MRQAAHRALRLLLLCSAALFLFGMAAAQAAGEPATSPLRVVAAFEEPLVASRAPSAADRAALHRALEAFERSPRGDLASLRAYADEQSHSPWRLSWLLNLGLLEYQQGYFSRALSTWQAAWSTGRDERAPLLAAQADRAFGELVRMHARLGLTESLERLLGEVEGRTAKVGVNVGNSMLPFDLSQSLSRAPAAIGQTYYPGPSQFAPMPVVP